MFRTTQVPSRLASRFRVQGFHLLRLSFPEDSPTCLQSLSRRSFNPGGCLNNAGLGSCAFARHYLRNHFCFLFLRVMRCFSSPGSPHASRDAATAGGGLPHSEIRVLTGFCPYARLIAACHVLLRLQEPRHPSCALFSFPFSFACSCRPLCGDRCAAFILFVRNKVLFM